MRFLKILFGFANHGPFYVKNIETILIVLALMKKKNIMQESPLALNLSCRCISQPIIFFKKSNYIWRLFGYIK